MFTIDERTIIKMYAGNIPDKNKVLAEIKNSINYADNDKIKDLMNDVIAKLNKITETQFKALDLIDVIDDLSAHID